MSAYYNEIDPYAAQWLRNLIAAGHIPPGDVDERSIVDVRPSDLGEYKQCHFFAGIGGWPLALSIAGWSDHRSVWTGSCPCQSISVAGHRKGHADERHLWPAFYSLIAECSPAIVFGEQVASKDGREWLSAVRADLEYVGYAIGAADLPAACKAPQIRQRLWWVARSLRERRKIGWDQFRPNDQAQESFARGSMAGNGNAAIEYEGIRESPVQLLPDAVPNAMAQLRAYGNAIVPQVAAEFIRCSEMALEK